MSPALVGLSLAAPLPGVGVWDLCPLARERSQHCRGTFGGIAFAFRPPSPVVAAEMGICPGCSGPLGAM